MPSIMQFPYRASRTGLWGEPTSTINWCEEDYNMTFYCAELVNTLTNLIFLWLGVRGILNVRANSHPPIFVLAFLGYLIIGIGSMAFHTSLKYSMQLADELPMIYTMSIMAFATFSYKTSRPARLLMASGFAGLAAFITTYYLYAKDPVFHQAAFGIMTASTVLKGFYDLIVRLRPALQRRSPGEVDNLMAEMFRLAWTGIVMFVFGFFIWNMDNIFCHHLIRARKHIMLPWAIVLEGHAWWHIWTGLGAYHMVIWRIWTQHCLDGDEREFMLTWSGPLGLFAEVIRKPGNSAKVSDSDADSDSKKYA